MTSRRDMRGLADRFVRRHAQDIQVLDADRLATGLQRYLPIETRSVETLSQLRSIVIDVAGQHFIPTKWGRLSDGGQGGERL